MLSRLSHRLPVSSFNFFRSCSVMRTMGTSSLDATLASELEGIKEAGTWKEERVITSPQAASISIDGSSVLNFCANNYLGLSNHPEVEASAKAAIDSHGFGLASVRFICGTQDIHRALEKKIAEFHGLEDAILYPSCFDANAGLFEVILTPEDAVISDSLNHASIIDGIRLCKAQRHRYEHMDMSDLERILVETQSARHRLVVTDGVFSMDGDIAPMKDICDLADKYDAQVFIDECHATGMFGKTGRGTSEYCGTEGRVHIINSTLGKALGGATGGYTAGSTELVTLLRQRARPYLFSNSVAPSVVGASITVFDMLTKDSSLVDKLRGNTVHFKTSLAAAGFELRGAPEHPICAVMLYDARLAAQFADKMLALGINVIGFSYPVVPKDMARIRVQLSASHSREDVQRAIDAFISVGKQLSVIE